MTSEIKTLGQFETQAGLVVPVAFLAYKTFGDPGLPAIMYPAWFSGSIADNEWLIGDDKTLSPKKNLIIIPALFGAGQSSSPSNQPEPWNGPNFPHTSLYDNVKHRLVFEHLGVKGKLFAVVGWSMAACQTFFRKKAKKITHAPSSPAHILKQPDWIS